MALSELKSQNRQEEADLLKRHKLEVEKMENEGLPVTSGSEPAEKQVGVAKPTSETPAQVDSPKVPTTREEPSIETTAKTAVGTIPIHSEKYTDDGEDWEEVVSKSRKQGNPGAFGNKSSSNNSANGASVSAVMSSVHVDAERSVRKLRVALTSGLLRKFKTKNLCIVGTREGNVLLETIRDNCPLMQQLCIIDNDSGELNGSISTLQKGTFGSVTSTIRPRQVALNISSFHVNAERIDALSDDIFTDTPLLKGESNADFDVIKRCAAEAILIPEYIHTLPKPQLNEFADFVFDVINPKILILTTVNKTFNAVYNMHDDQVRYATHKFEFTNREFISWCSELSERYGYDVSHGGVGDAPKDFKAGVQSSLWAYFVYNEKKYLAKKTFGRFSRVLEKLIYEWPIVQFAMAHDTGGFNTAQKVDKLFEDLEFNFLERWERTKSGKKNGEIFPDEIEPFLDEVLIEDLNIEAEDGSCKLLANSLVDLFNQAVVDDWKKADAIMNMNIKSSVAKVEGADENLTGDDEKDVGGEGDADDDISSCVFPTLVWKHVIHDVVMQGGGDGGSTARAVDKSGKNAQKKQKKHMKDTVKKNSKQNKAKVSYSRANS